MKTRKAKVLLLTISVIILVLGIGFGFPDNEKEQSKIFYNEFSGTSKADVQKKYFEDWFYPFNEITTEMRNDMKNQIEQLPDDLDAVNNWVLWGPNGQRIWNSGNIDYYSGRIVDIEVDNGASTRVASASGGLWGFAIIFPISLSDNLTNTLNIGSFDSKPGDANTIIIASGEPYTGMWGAGMFKTVNGGASYTQCTMTPVTPSAFYKVRYSASNTNVVHAGSIDGYYRSINGGDTWTRINFAGSKVSDIAINPANNDIIYSAVMEDGIYKSTNAGLNWTKLTTGGIPTTNIGRTTISIAASNTNTVYLNIAKNTESTTLGVYKTTNGGTNWINVSPPVEFHWGQGWYNSLCGVSPTDANKIIVGGGSLWRSFNGGTSWTEITNTHADQHAIAWTASGASVWVCNDGGMFYSGDGGITFTSSSNYLPITQYVIFDVHPSGSHVFGGSQDNGISGSTNRGSTWYHFLGGDGGGMAIDPFLPNSIVATNGVYGGNWAFRRVFTLNGGPNWDFMDNGIDPSGTWYHAVRNDKVYPVYLFNHSGKFVYRATSGYGSTWSKLNPTAFPEDVGNLSVSRFTAPSATVYACLNPGTPVNGVKIRVYDGSTFSERSTGLPSNNNVRHVAPHPTNANIAYALINGWGAGERVYRTTNKGINWINVTGNLPNIPVSSLIAHPTDNDKLYLGTVMGCYKTTNGGANWMRWNNGMPNAINVQEMRYIDSVSTNGRFYVVAATYGRSIYYREISGDDPIAIDKKELNIPDKFELAQNYPNPFNPSTTIKFLLPVNDKVIIDVFDITGKHVGNIVNDDLKAGTHEFVFEATGLSSGIYFYRMISSKLTETKKMMLVK